MDAAESASKGNGICRFISGIIGTALVDSSDSAEATTSKTGKSAKLVVAANGDWETNSEFNVLAELLLARLS